MERSKIIKKAKERRKILKQLKGKMKGTPMNKLKLLFGVTE